MSSSEVAAADTQHIELRVKVLTGCDQTTHGSWASSALHGTTRDRVFWVKYPLFYLCGTAFIILIPHQDGMNSDTDIAIFYKKDVGSTGSNWKFASSIPFNTT